jgi:ribose transport system substrate-binding protein
MFITACAPAATQEVEENVDETTETLVGEETEGYLIGCTMMDESNPFYVSICDTVEEEVAKRGGEVVRIDGAADQIIQNNAIDDMIAQGIDALVLTPVDKEGVLPALERLEEEGIPVFNVDSAVGDLSKVVSFISANNYQAGFILGEEMMRVYPDGANFAIIDAPAVNSVVDRVNGILDAIEGSNIVVVEQQSYISVDAILNQAENIMLAHPDLDCFYAINDPISLIVAGAIDSAGKSDEIKIFSVDGAPEGKQAIADGVVAATSAQSPVQMATLAVDFAYRYLGGETDLPHEVPMDTVLINSDNVGDYSLEAWE